MSAAAVTHQTTDPVTQSQREHRVVLSDVSGDVTLGRVIRAEWGKLLSLRSIRWTVAPSVVLGLGLCAVILSGYVSAEHRPSPMEYAIHPPAVAVLFGVLVFGVLGVLTITNEYTSGMILSSAVAVPRRGMLFWGKLIAVATLVLGLSVLLEVLALVMSGIFEPAMWGTIGEPQVITAALGVVSSLTLVSLFAFGLGSLLRSSAAAISTVLALLFVAPLLFGFLLGTGWEWVPTVLGYLPSQLTQTLTTGLIPAAELAETALPYWGAFVSLVAWAAVTVLPAWVLFVRRDAK